MITFADSGEYPSHLSARAFLPRFPDTKLRPSGASSLREPDALIEENNLHARNMAGATVPHAEYIAEHCRAG